MLIGTRKPRPANMVVFGASGHMGGPLARHARFVAPDVSLRLVTSSEAKRAALAAEFPDCEVVMADLFLPETLDVALDGAQGVFLVTPSPFDEQVAMTNFVEAMHRVGKAIHVVRIVGYEPESLPRRVPASIQAWGGTAQQHYVAKRLLDESDLPVTYFNIGATYLDNFLAMAGGIRDRQLLIYPQRSISFIDARDIGEAAANMLLSNDERHFYQFLTLNNGHDLLTTQQMVAVMEDVFKRRITLDTSRESFVATFGEALAKRRGRPDAAEQVLDFTAYEQGNSSFQHLNDWLERLLGRDPVTLRAWLMEHRHHFTGDPAG